MDATSFSDVFRHGLASLELLDLSNNEISSVTAPLDSVAHKSLRTVHFENNHLAALRKDWTMVPSMLNVVGNRMLRIDVSSPQPCTSQTVRGTSSGHMQFCLRRACKA